MPAHLTVFGSEMTINIGNGVNRGARVYSHMRHPPLQMAHICPAMRDKSDAELREIIVKDEAAIRLHNEGKGGFDAEELLEILNDLGLNGDQNSN